MTDAIRICLFDATGLKDPPFQQPFQKLSHVQIVGLATGWEELRDWLRHTCVDIVAINLDDAKGQGLEAVSKTVQIAPGCSILGLSGQTDPAHIIQAMRAGCSQFVPWPVDIEDLKTAVGRIRAMRKGSLHSSRRICVIGSSGGVGATMVACNLAIELGHLTDRRCALVDMNLEFGDVGCAFDCTPRYSIADVCRDGVDADHLLISKAIHELPSNLAVMARPEEIEQARHVTPEGVQAMLCVMSELYPYIVVDLPRTFSFLSAAAVAQADRSLIITQPNVTSIRNATRIYRCLLQMGAEDDRVEIVLNRCKASFERISPDDIKAHFRRPVFAMIPNDYRRVQSALDLGHPVMKDSPNSPARLAIQDMARKIAGEQATAEDPAAAGGLWGKLLGRGSRPRE